MMFVQLLSLWYASSCRFVVEVKPTLKLWLPVTYDIDARALRVMREKWTVLPRKRNPMLRDIVSPMASNAPGMSVRASKWAPAPEAPYELFSANRSLTFGICAKPASNRMRLVCGRAQLSWYAWNWFVASLPASGAM